MITNDKDLIQAMKMVRLSEGTRTRMRENLLAYADLHSMPTSSQSSFNMVGFVVGVLSRSRPVLAGAVVVVLVAGGGGVAALAAEQSVPGDALYAVKVQVNEPIASVFAGSGEAQARYHAKLAVRRVEEAEALAKRGELSVAVAEDLSARFDTETEKAVAAADKLESTGDVSASIAIRAELSENLNTQVTLAHGDIALASASGDVAATAAIQAPVARTMKSAAVLESADSVVPVDVAQIFRLKVAGVIARLDTTRGRAEVAVADYVVEEEPAGEPGAGTAKQVVITRSANASAETPRALLAGASVVRSAAKNASTTASSTDATGSTTPALGTAFLKKLIRTREDGRGEDHAVPVTSIPAEVTGGLVPSVTSGLLGQ